MELLIHCLLIIIARVTDVSLGTLRMVFVVKNRRTEAVLTGFFEAFIWVYAVGTVASNLDEPVLILAYAIGYALGNFVGLTIERKLALGDQVLRVFTRNSEEILKQLRDQEYRITTFKGEGRDSPIDMLLVKSSRRKVRKAVALVRELDKSAFFFIDDIGESSERAEPFMSPLGWRGRVKKI